MTTVTLERTGSKYTDFWYTVEAKGHATGRPEVCTAVSILIQTLHTWLEASGATMSEKTIGSGECRLRFTGKGCGTAFEVVQAGFMRMAATNPKDVKCVVKR